MKSAWIAFRVGVLRRSDVKGKFEVGERKMMCALLDIVSALV